MTLKLSLEECETICSQMGDDHSKWTIVSDDPMWLARLERMGFEPTSNRGPTYWFEVPANAVLVRKPPAKRQASAAQLANLRGVKIADIGTLDDVENVKGLDTPEMG